MAVSVLVLNATAQKRARPQHNHKSQYGALPTSSFFGIPARVQFGMRGFFYAGCGARYAKKNFAR